MIDVSIETARQSVDACEAALHDLKTGGGRTGDAEVSVKMQFARANSTLDHAGRRLGHDPWSASFNPPKAKHTSERSGREWLGKVDPAKSGAFIRALEDNLQAMKDQLAVLGAS